MNIIGYLDRLSYAPGATVHGKFSTPASGFGAGLARLINGDAHPLGPGVDIRDVPSVLDGREFAGRVQPIRAGSYVRTEEGMWPDGAELLMAIKPTLASGAGHPQTVVALTSGDSVVAEVVIDEGQAFLRTGEGVAAAGEVVSNRWYGLALSLAGSTAELVLTSSYGDKVSVQRKISISRFWGSGAGTDGGGHEGAAAEAGADGSVSSAAGRRTSVTFAADHAGQNHFNGRIDHPTLSAGGTIVADWDFGPSETLRQIANRKGPGFHGESVNFPMRACLGINGVAEDVDPRLAPGAYQAIHFHDDDLDDAGWEDDLTLELPEDLPSGVYGILVTATDGTRDTVPFVVTPGDNPRKRALVVLPTFSYLAYSCEHVMADPGARDYLKGVGVGEPPEFGGNVHDSYLLAHGLRSLYDVHTDGTGVCFTSTRKPLPNVRPEHRWAAVAGGETSAHQFSADLHLIAWLDAEGFDVDVITDEEVHREGLAALAPYRVVLTGSHPEYPTTAMMAAYESYLEQGGRLMYLGGNGFYWVTSIDPEREHTIEIRRTAGIRAWQPEPGEWHHATTGELGGLWRLRGKAPQKMLGVGMASQGFDTNRPYEVVTPVPFVFAGIEGAKTIGDFPSLVNGHGAAGVEIDRADRALGTPDDTIVLATATGFSRAYGLDPVEVQLPDGNYDGTTSDKVRCDLVLVPKPNGGAVFSTGSIAWCGSLLAGERRNDVSIVTGNVLRAFLDQESLI
ncbi:N,N-dimethylformamidase beta subunit family domain-containing protein [Paractinoplanes brasiliensis]|uniref:N,N-dimethylformamidase n=1 Tax=Paractinoplanes brasiliensis TaxID=52695 RepID=A0A4R6JMJ0_9ACTN|nr:N,N-dimethylformamidase beta subunit family domain-containing protein [Actinoplanes brasiliensis]TDO37359.1 N,N-dimethylformamidase [Actinoplanes brasiliensis]GID29324.1 large subunit of N,N-dimethylformamidase [Actinoplanes brasiliensis]